MNSLQWLQMLLSYLVQTSLVIGVAWGLERWATGSRLKARIWSACYLNLLGLLIAGLVLPRLQWFHPWSHLQPNELLKVANTEHWLGSSMLVIWILGCWVMIVRWGVLFVMLQRFIRSCPSLTVQESTRLSALVCDDLSNVNGRSVEFRESREELGPFCYQFHQPIVFLPRSMIDGDAVSLRHVLHHELTHLKTQHPMHLFVQRVTQVVLWFHPLVWISCRRASLVREFVCDDASSGEGSSTSTYLRTLVQIVEARAKPQSGTLAIGRSAKDLKIRAQRLVALSPSPSSSTIGWGSLLVLMFVAVGASQLWLPTNPLASSSARWSPWPSWSAATLHAFDMNARDFEKFDSRTQLHELLKGEDESFDVR